MQIEHNKMNAATRSGTYCLLSLFFIVLTTNRVVSQHLGGIGADQSIPVEKIHDIKKSVVSIECITSHNTKRVGTGFIYDPTGIVLTRTSVVKNADKIRVKLWDGTYKRGSLLSMHTLGVALLGLEQGTYQSARLADLSTLRPDSRLTIIGNSLGIFPSVTLAALAGRQTSGLLRLRAVLPQGNTGSPIFNSRGEIVGIITGRDSRVKDIGLALPLDLMRNEIEQFIAMQKKYQGWVGLVVKEVAETQGVVITHIEKESPSYDACLSVGDTIVSFDGREFSTLRELIQQVQASTPGEEKTFTVREGKNRVTHIINIGRKSFLK